MWQKDSNLRACAEGLLIQDTCIVQKIDLTTLFSLIVFDLEIFPIVSTSKSMHLSWAYYEPTNTLIRYLARIEYVGPCTNEEVPVIEEFIEVTEASANTRQHFNVTGLEENSEYFINITTVHFYGLGQSEIIPDGTTLPARKCK